MAFQPAQDTVSVEFKYTDLAGHRFQNTFHLSRIGFTNADIDTLVSLVAGYWDTSLLRTKLSIDVTLATIKVTDLRTEGAYTVETTVNSAGTGNEDQVPVSSAVVVTMRTALRGRSFRGRSYITGTIKNEFVNGVYSVNTTSACQAFVVGLQTAVAGQGWDLVVLSRAHNGVKRAVALPFPITSVVIRSQREGNRRDRSDRG